MQLPDFEDMVKASEEIARLSVLRSMTEIEIKIGECEVFKRASTEERFFQGGKPASTTFIENTYKYTGLDGELINKRKYLAQVSADLELERSRLEFMKTQIEVWRSEQANQRMSLAP